MLGEQLVTLVELEKVRINELLGVIDESSRQSM